MGLSGAGAAFLQRYRILESSCPLCFFLGPNEQGFKFKSSPLLVPTRPEQAAHLQEAFLVYKHPGRITLVPVTIQLSVPTPDT